MKIIAKCPLAFTAIFLAALSLSPPVRSAPTQPIYTLEGRSQSLSAQKCGFGQFEMCCPPLLRTYHTCVTSNTIDLRFSRDADCQNPTWTGTYWERISLTDTPDCTTNWNDFCEGAFNYRMGDLTVLAARDCSGWWITNGSVFHTTDPSDDLYFYFALKEPGSTYTFWEWATRTEVKSCTEKITIDAFPSCSTAPSLPYDYLAGTNTTLESLANEFTTLELIVSNLQVAITNEWAPCGKESPRAGLWLSENEVQGALTNVEARLKVFCPAYQRFSIEYSLCHQWLSNGVSVVTKTKNKATGQGTGYWQYVQLPLPDPWSTYTTNGCLFYRPETWWIEMPCGGGSACSSGLCSDSPGSAAATLTDGGLFLQATLGPSAFARGAASLMLIASAPSPTLTTPDSVQLMGDFNGAAALRSAGAVRQVMNAGGNCLADIQAINPTSFAIRFYTNWDAGLGGLYDPSPYPPFSSVTIAQGISTNQVVITIDSGTPYTHTYDWSDSDKAWTLTTGGGLRKETRSWNEVSLTRTNTIRDAANAIVYQEVQYYADLPDYGRVLTREVIGPSGPALTTQYFYYDNAATDGTNYGSLKMTVQPSGFWQRYECDSLARVTKEVSQFLNGVTNAPENQCRVVQYDYSSLDAGNPSETRIEKLLGVEIARSYSMDYPSASLSIRCAAPGATWTDPANLVTFSTIYSEGPYSGKPLSVFNPDGTIQLYSYGEFNGDQLTTVRSGAPDSTFTDITNGTITVTSVTSGGQAASPTVYDVALNNATGQEPEINPTVYYTFDGLGRHNSTLYKDETQEVLNFGCCGLESMVDRQGVTTIYIYDPLKRQIGTLRNGVTTTNLLDAAGNVLATFRVGSDGTVITNSRAVFDVAGRVTFETNAFGGPTSFTETNDGSGQTFKTTVYPDGGTRVETFFQDGSLQRVTGTAVFPVRYEYGIENDGDGATNSFTKEIKLDASYADTAEWTKTYTDILGRSYKTVYSAASTPLPFRKSFYNSLGQLWKEVDPDGVVTLYQYNTKGDLEYTVLDMDRDGQIDFAGTDRITRTVSEYIVPPEGLTWLSTSTYVWAQDGVDSPTLLSISRSSLSSQAGTETKTIAGGVTNHTVIENNWNLAQRTTTTYAPDGSRTVAVARYGTNESLMRRTGPYSKILDVLYACDAFGRQNQVAEMRPDNSYATNITFYNAGDQVCGTISPPPAEGQPPQVTTNFFDNMGRLWRAQLPDGTSVTNEYFPTGLLKKTYGSRTYPVEYTYDAQGRMKTMKTWQNFAGNSGTATTTWNYDANRGWLQGKSYADGLGPLYTNTAAGRLQTRIWARSVAGQRLTTTYGYNNIGDLTTVSYSDGSPGISYGYHRQGRRTSAAQAGMTTTSTFTDTGLLLSESFSGGPLEGLSVTNVYDEFLRRTNLVLQQSSNPLVQQSFGYDDYSRLHSVAEGDNTATYSYVANGSRVGHITFSNQTQTVMTTSNAYDSLHRLTSIATTDAQGQVLDSHAYVYNNANQRTSHTLGDGSYWVYTYDGLGQVTSGKKYFADGSPVPGQQFTYGFDDIGNRKYAGAGGDQWGGNLHAQNYSANSLNQYTSRTVPGFADVIGSANSNATVTLWGDNAASAQTIRKGEYFYGALPVNNSTGAVWLTLTNIAVLPDGTNPDIVTNTTGKALVPKTAELFIYDADGNLTSDSLWTNTWNAENRRSLVESRTAVASAARALEQWTYLPDGRWIERIVSVWTGSGYVSQSTNRYLWDGEVLMAVLDHTNGVVLSFLRGLDLSGSVNGAGGVGGLIAVSQWSNSQVTNSHFACFDGNGNVMGLVSGNDGGLSAEYGYGPFGEPIRATGFAAQANPIRFSTQFSSHTTGELKYQWRTYAPRLGRWLTRDPSGDRRRESLYSFARNIPVSQFDPNGREAQDAISPALATLPPLDVAPCAWGGWKYTNNLQTLGLTDIRPDDGITAKEVVDYEECNSSGAECKFGPPLKPQCTITVYFLAGTDPNRGTQTTVLWKHERKHATDFLGNFKRELIALDLARKWCLPPECHEVRRNYVTALFIGYMNAWHYKSYFWDAQDYDDEAYREQRRQSASKAMEALNDSRVEIQKLRADLTSSLHKHGMSDIWDWPAPPSLQ